MPTDLSKTVQVLCQASRRHAVDPHTYVEWPTAIDPDEWAFSPELLSLYGTPVWDEMGEEQRRRLSFYETVNFFSLNIHGEKSLIQGLAQRLYQTGREDVSPYLHHFLDEENKHMVYFGGFCQRYAGKVYRDRKIAFPREYAPGEEDFLFFARVLIFEEIVDVYNLRMASDQRLPEVVRRINRIHHLEESRHLAFGRLVVRQLFEEWSPTWSADTLAGVRQYLQGYLHSTWREYYNPDVYRDVGLRDPLKRQGEALGHEACRAHRASITAKCLRFLAQSRILEGASV